MDVHEVWDMSSRVQSETVVDLTRGGAAWSVATRIIQETESETRLAIRLPTA